MIKIFFIYVLTLLFKNYCIYYNKNISLNKFKDCIRTNLLDNDVYSFVDTPENIEELSHSFQFLSLYCINNIDDKKINSLIYFEIINV